MLPTSPWKEASLPRYIVSRRSNRLSPMTRAEIAATIEEALVLANDTLHQGDIAAGGEATRTTTTNASSDEPCTTSQSCGNEPSSEQQLVVAVGVPFLASDQGQTVDVMDRPTTPRTNTRSNSNSSNADRHDNAHHNDDDDDDDNGCEDESMDDTVIRRSHEQPDE